MAEYDGSIRIGVSINSEDAKKKLEHLRNRLVNQTKEIESQTKEVQRLEAQYKKLTSSSVEPKGIQKMESDLKKSQEEAAKLDAELQRLQQMAAMDMSANGFVNPETASIIQEISAQLSAADSRVDALNRGLENLKMPPESTESAKELKGELDAAKEKLGQSKQAAAETADQIKGMETASTGWKSKLSEAASRLKSSIAKSLNTSARSAKTLHSRMEKVGRSRGLDKARKSASRLSESLRRAGRRLREIVSGALLFNIISRALTALTKKMGEYLMANKDFASSLGTIKGNLLTAFQPIYEAVMPALNKLMETLKEASAVAAKFVAGLFGTTAEKAQQNAKALHDQAKATEEVADETKKAEKFLASFDTIEILGNKEDENKKDNAKEEAKFDQDYSDVKVPAWLEKLGEVIKSIKDALKDLFAPIKEAWDKYGTPVIEALKRAFSSVWDLIKAIAKTFMEIWNSPLIQTTLQLIMSLLTLIFDIIADIADTFRKVWESGAGKTLLTNLALLLNTILGIIYDIAAAFREAWSNYGEQVVQALFFALNSVLELLQHIGESFREAWNDNGRGQKIWETILQIVGKIFETIGLFAGKLKEAWDANGNGKAIWAAILDIVQYILDFINDIVDATMEWAKNIDLEPLISGVRDVLEELGPLIQSIGEVLSEIYNEYILPLFQKLIEEWLPWVLEKLADLFNWLANHKEILKTVAEAVLIFIAAWKLGSIISSLAKMVSSINVLGLALGGAVTAVGLLIANWSKMNTLEKTVSVIGAVVAALGALCVMLAYAKGGVAGVALGVGAIVAGLATVALASASANKRSSASGSFGGGFGGYSTSSRMASMSNMARVASYPGIENIPHLAKGAVISPNSEYLAVLGDQRSGTNIESPLSTIEQALDNVLSQRGDVGGATDVTINFTGSLSQLARILQPQITVAERRRGISMVNTGGGTYE